MITDKFLSEITGKDKFTDQEYKDLRKQYKDELAQKYAENPQIVPIEPTPPEPTPVDKNKLQADKTRLEEELSILQLQGYDALQKFREEKSITDGISNIDKQLI